MSTAASRPGSLLRRPLMGRCVAALQVHQVLCSRSWQVLSAATELPQDRVWWSRPLTDLMKGLREPRGMLLSIVMK